MMKRTERLVAGAVLALTMLAATTAAAAGDAAKGKTLFTEKCTACHGMGGKGDGPMASGMSPPPANFTDPAFWKDKTDATLSSVISGGHLDMPPMDSNPQDVQDLIAYLKTLKK